MKFRKLNEDRERSNQPNRKVVYTQYLLPAINFCVRVCVCLCMLLRVWLQATAISLGFVSQCLIREFGANFKRLFCASAVR